MRAHGTRARYVFGPGPGQDRSKGCRCEECSEANRVYARFHDKRARLRAAGYQPSDPESRWAAPLVDAGPVRDHVLALADRGVGYKRVAELAGVGKTALLQIRQAKRARVTRELAAAVLAVPLDTPPADPVLVDARPTWKLVRLILRQPGWTKARLSAEIGQGGRALQLGGRHVTQRNARAVADIAERLGLVDPPGDTRRFPLAPLLRTYTIGELATAAGLHRKQLDRWRRSGIPASRADQLAVSIGTHPFDFWPDWYDSESESVA